MTLSHLFTKWFFVGTLDFWDVNKPYKEVIGSNRTTHNSFSFVLINIANKLYTLPDVPCKSFSLTGTQSITEVKSTAYLSDNYEKFVTTITFWQHKINHNRHLCNVIKKLIDWLHQAQVVNQNPSIQWETVWSE